MFPKILLLQVREPGVDVAEQDSIIGLSGHPTSDFECRNFLSEDLAELDVSLYSHVLMGGSSAYNLSKTPQPWFSIAKQKILDCEQFDIPFLGLCYGMQFLAAAFGAQVLEVPESRSNQPQEVTLHDIAGTFLEFLPPKFISNFIHNDTVVDLKRPLISVGSTPICPNALIRHESKPMFGTQFHFEINQDYVRYVLKTFYSGKYGHASESDAIIAGIVNPSGAVSELISRFVNL